MSFADRSDGNGVPARCDGGRSPSIPALGAALVATALLASPLALAEEIRISRGDCASGVHLVARDAHFSDVLKRLAKALDFQLSFESKSDPLVNVDAAMQPSDFPAWLAPEENISVTQATDPRCPYQTRILKLWVLAKARENGSPVPVSPQQIQPTAETAEQARQAQEGLDSVLKAHGFNRGRQEGSQ